MSNTYRRLALAAAVLMPTAFRAPSAPARPAALVLDGLRDEGYHLVAQDPIGDLAAGFALTATAWADLTNLYVTTDTTSLWVYADLPNYNANSYGQFGLAVDTDGLAGSGGIHPPMVSSGITFAYTSTYNNVGSSPVFTTSHLLPDVVIHGNLYSSAMSPAGWTELNHWTGAAWDDVNVNWGGVQQAPTGTYVSFAFRHGLELRIPFADLGIGPASTVHLELFSIGPQAPGQPTGAVDTIPSDDQAPADRAATTQQRLATFNPTAAVEGPHFAFSASNYAGTEAQGTVPVTITVTPTSTQLISVTFAASSGTAGPEDFLPVTQMVTLTPGVAARVINLHVLSDALAEPDETVLLSLSQSINAQLGQPVTATLTIHNSALNARLFLPLMRR